MTRPTLRTILVLAPVILLGALAVWVFSVPEADALLSSTTSLYRDGEETAVPAADPGEAHPILVLVDRSDPHPFAWYVCEIFRTEGLFTFDVADLSAPGWDPVALAGRRLVIGASQSARLERLEPQLRRYVAEGGNLLLHLPGPVFDDLLGIRSDGPAAADGFLVADPGTGDPPGAEELQLFGPWRKVQPDGTDPLAVLRETRGSGAHWTAAGIRRAGAGSAAFLAFDPGTSVVYTRQGRPPGVVMDRDGDGAFRTADLFAGMVDAQLPFVPHADGLQRFLVALVYDLLGADAPPRIWYFPDGADAVALITGDAHDTPREMVLRMADTVAAAGGRFSLIEYPRALDSSYVSLLRLRGHDVAPHPHYPRTEDPWTRWRLKLARGFAPMSFFQPRLTEMVAGIAHATDEFRLRTGDSAVYTRMHFLSWWGWSETAHALADQGIRMDLSCTGFDPGLAFAIPAAGGARSPAGFGYATGSGRPMRYITEGGGLLPIFGQLTQVEDDVLGGALYLHSGTDSGVVAGAVAICRRLIDESISRYHTVLAFNLHPEHAAIRWPPMLPRTMAWIAPTLAHLSAARVPMPDVRTWVSFVEARQALEMRWHPAGGTRGRTRVRLGSFRAVRGVTLLMPIGSAGIRGDDQALVTCGGEARAVPVARVRLLGREWLRVILDIPAGIPADVFL